MKKVLKQSIIALLVAGAAGAAGAATNSNETATDDQTNKPIEAKDIYPIVYDNGQILRGFKEGDDIITDINESDGKARTKKATKEDVESDPFKGVGLVQAVVDLKGGIIQVADDLGKTIEAVNKNTKLLDEHSEAITEIGDLVEDNSKAIADLEKTSAAHSENLDKLNQGIEAVENNLNDTVKTVQKNTEAVTKNAEAVSKNAEAVSKNAEAVSKNAELLSKHTDAITKTADLANENSQAIADLKRIANQDLSNIQNKADKSELIALSKELKRGLAAQAALNGLFQPYSIGKANVTAAFGGYKKYTAVAIGTGYRFNENFAAKAGVAFTKGSTTYNAGVNFEW
ncbi:YadA-like family protein [Haemophilus influenzae]|uniref:YadA-like family protein n=1 Tax=Haemophilus influenzae TaxID=727 RepID=UPI000D47BFD0|nr:Adhesin YadA precursor [Haemophilus influenzae]